MQYPEYEMETFWRNLLPNFEPFFTWGQPLKSKVFVILFITLISITTYVKISKRNRTHRNGKTSLYHVLPRIQWTFLNLFMLDGLIAIIKVRKYGIRVIDQIIEKCGPNFRVTVTTKRAIVITDPKIIQTLLSSTDPGHLNKPRFLYGLILTDFMKNGAVAAEFKTWSVHRKAISRAFNYNSITYYGNFMHEAARSLVASACSFAKQAGGIIENMEFKELLELHTIKVIIEIIMGSETTNMSDMQCSEFTTAFRRAKELMIYRLLHPYLWIPPIWRFNKKKQELDQMIEIMNKFSKKIINNYRQKHIKEMEIGKGLQKRNLGKTGEFTESESQTTREANNYNNVLGIKPFECIVEQMIKAGLGDTEILDEVNTLMVTGHETILNAMEFLLFHLAGNMVHQRKCQMEIDELMKSHLCVDTENMSLENLSELKFLDRCILESLRLSPIVPAFGRQLDKALEISSDYIIDSGSVVVILPWAVHRNPENYPNPEIFDPDRFLPENIQKRHSHSFIPFSMGNRNCIGWKIALFELKVFTAWILRHFEVTTTDGPNDVKIYFDISLKPERPFHLQLKARKESMPL